MNIVITGGSGCIGSAFIQVLAGRPDVEFATDVDGVLTDAGMYYGESGEELKKFNTRDGMGIKLLQAEGVIVAIITAEQTKIVARRAKKLGISEVFQGAKDKVSILTQLSEKLSIPFDY